MVNPSRSGEERKATKKPGTRGRKQAAKPQRTRARTVRESKASSVYAKYFFEGVVRGGGFDLRTDLGVARAIRSGVPTEAVDEAIETGAIASDVLYEYVIPRRTLAHRESRELPLSQEQSDRLARVLRVYVRAEDVLGDAERASRWLRKPNRALGGTPPLELLSSEAGARAVDKVLGRVEHGVFS